MWVPPYGCLKQTNKIENSHQMCPKQRVEFWSIFAGWKFTLDVPKPTCGFIFAGCILMAPAPRASKAEHDDTFLERLVWDPGVSRWCSTETLSGINPTSYIAPAALPQIFLINQPSKAPQNQSFIAPSGLIWQLWLGMDTLNPCAGWPHRSTCSPKILFIGNGNHQMVEGLMNSQTILHKGNTILGTVGPSKGLVVADIACGKHHSRNSWTIQRTSDIYWHVKGCPSVCSGRTRARHASTQSSSLLGLSPSRLGPSKSGPSDLPKHWHICPRHRALHYESLVLAKNLNYLGAQLNGKLSGWWSAQKTAPWMMLS